MHLLRSISDSPTFNCALEEYLLTERPEKDVLLFYINRPSVIVGRNQKIEAEVNTEYCRLHGIEVIKRISGGGTVYHDYGNINYSFIVDKTGSAVLDRDFGTPLTAALATLGIPTAVGARKELLTTDGYKISGTAAHITRDSQLFHGTLLYRTDLTVLKKTLQGDHTLRGRSVASVSSPVTNLSVYRPEHETTEEFLALLCQFFEGYYQTDPIQPISTSTIRNVKQLLEEKEQTTHQIFE